MADSTFFGRLRHGLLKLHGLIFYIFKKNRSSHQRCSMKNGVLRNCTKFTRKYLCQSPFFFLKKRDSGADVFCEFGEISKKIFFTEHLWTTTSGKNRRPKVKLTNHLSNLIFKQKTL